MDDPTAFQRAMCELTKEIAQEAIDQGVTVYTICERRSQAMDAELAEALAPIYAGIIHMEQINNNDPAMLIATMNYMLEMLNASPPEEASKMVQSWANDSQSSPYLN